ncbi:MAG: molybdenum cofactor biosynthesis protein MoaE [Propionibacteriales bacterium]|nr:molybdenum cofactor biosynthesis protein MoaE [Propionibacteriales bacterium]
MSGTAGNTVRLLGVRDTPLDTGEVLAAVQDQAAGGVNLFVGAVRDHDHGLGVVRLEYSAHPTALDKLAEVAEEVAAEFDVIALAAVHRIGVLDVGDLAVVSAVSAAHRDQAFAASRALIDRLKERVPIWKHQVFSDGTDEWVGSC